MNLHIQVIFCEILFSLVSSDKIQQLPWSCLELNLDIEIRASGSFKEQKVSLAWIYMYVRGYGYLIEQINEINIIRFSSEVALKDPWNMVAKDNPIVYSNKANLLYNKKTGGWLCRLEVKTWKHLLVIEKATNNRLRTLDKSIV